MQEPPGVALRLRDKLPAGLRWLRASDAGRAWIDSLPRLRQECATEWNLRLGEPFADAQVSLALPASRADGTDVVLKIQFPDRESEQEPDALRLWDGDGAIRLLAHDPERHALLLERCLPGSPLAGIEPDEALDVLIRLLPRLWRPAVGPFRPLADEAAWWASDLVPRWERAGRPFERRLLDIALDALRTLPESQEQSVVLHQDLHASNVLRAEREPWLVIDPKPLAGERAFGVAPIVRSVELGHGRRAVLHRLDRLTAELGLDRRRAALWSLAQTVAWSFGSGASSRHIETAGWLMEDLDK